MDVDKCICHFHVCLEFKVTKKMLRYFYLCVLALLLMSFYFYHFKLVTCFLQCIKCIACQETSQQNNSKYCNCWLSKDLHLYTFFFSLSRCLKVEILKIFSKSKQSRTTEPLLGLFVLI